MSNKIWKIIEKRNWQNVRNSFSWIQDMEEVPQDKVHHAEGDVAIHTRMVVEALLNLSEFQRLEEQDKEILFAAALLHDVEKRSTTVHEPDGRITSRGHARKGEFSARRILYKEIPTPFVIREAVAKLVRNHGLPIWIFEKENPIKTLLQTSLEVDLAHLAILAKADMLGRICQDQSEMLYRIQLFEEFCKENNCFGNKKKFGSDLGKYQFFQKAAASPDYVPFEKDTFEVIMLSALPGTGKDFFIKKNYKNIPVVSLDAIRRENKISPTDKKGNGQVIQIAKEQARVFLRKKESFIWNATNITRNLRTPLIDLFQTYGAKTKLIYLEVPYQKLIQQNRNREFPVPQKVLEKMILKLEVPSIWETPIVEIHHFD
ncbi:MAG: AAA family ATPase [Saprospiraceae bacterium]